MTKISIRIIGDIEINIVNNELPHENWNLFLNINLQIYILVL